MSVKKEYKLLGYEYGYIRDLEVEAKINEYAALGWRVHTLQFGKDQVRAVLFERESHDTV